MPAVSLACRCVLLPVAALAVKAAVAADSPSDAMPEATRLGLKVHHLSAPAAANSVFSPLGLEMVLAMAREGAATTTLTQIDKALGWEGREDTARSALRTRLSALDTPETARPPGAVMQLCRGLWPHAARPLEPAFVAALRNDLHAEVTPLDFTGDHGGSLALINAWVARQTGARIPRLLSDADVSSDGPARPTQSDRHFIT